METSAATISVSSTRPACVSTATIVATVYCPGACTPGIGSMAATGKTSAAAARKTSAAATAVEATTAAMKAAATSTTMVLSVSGRNS